MSDKVHFNDPSLKGKIRATFVDSFELEGANWCDGMLEKWEKYFGYSLYPYLPYIIKKIGHMGNPLPENYGSTFSEKIKKDVEYRVRNDFERFQIYLFQENFINTLNDWCRKNGVQSRVQAYGRALHPLESSMYIDISPVSTILFCMDLIIVPAKPVSRVGCNTVIISTNIIPSGRIIITGWIIRLASVLYCKTVFRSRK